MTKIKKYTYNGESLTLKQWSEKTGVPYATLFNRLKKLKWSLEKTLTTPLIDSAENATKYTYKGESLTLKGWSRKTGISYITLFNRLKKFKWSLEKTLTTPAKVGRGKTYTYNGKSLTLVEWSKIVGISHSTLIVRLNKLHWSLEETLNTPLSYNEKKYNYNGKSLTLEEWSKETGVSKTTLASRIGILKWSLEKALTTPPKSSKNSKKYTHNGKSLTLEEWSKETGINKATLYSRIGILNWSLEKALTTPLISNKNTNKYTYNGRSLTLDEWSKETGISKSVLVTRMETHKWSLERALTTPVRYRRHKETKKTKG